MPTPRRELDLLQEMREGVAPPGEVFGVAVLKIVKLAKLGLASHEQQRRVGARAGAELVHGDLVLLRGVPRERHVVHRALRVHDEAEVRREPGHGEEAARKSNLKRVGVREPRVLGQEVVKVRGSRARVTEHEHGLVVQLLCPDLGAVEEPVGDRADRVQCRHERDEEKPRKVSEVLDLRPSSAEKAGPLEEGDAAQRVVLDAMTSPEVDVDDGRHALGRSEPR